MRNHVHVVVLGCPDDGPGVRRALKGRGQADLSRAFGVRKWWTTGGSDRYLHDGRSILGAVRYTANQHGVLAEIENGLVLPPRAGGDDDRAGGFIPPGGREPPARPDRPR